MALEEYEGAIVMELDGAEIDVVSVDTTTNTGRKPVRTMNATGRPKGFAKGIEEISLRVTVPIPADGNEPAWKAVEGAKITVSPQSGGKRTSYLDCFVTDVSRAYSVDNEARRDLQMTALREVEE